MIDFNKTNEEILAIKSNEERFFYYINEAIAKNRGVNKTAKVKDISNLAKKWHIGGIMKSDFIHLRLNEIDSLSKEDSAIVYKFAKLRKQGRVYEPQLSFFTDFIETPEEYTSEVDMARTTAPNASEELYNNVVSPMYNRALDGIEMDLYLTPDGKSFACRCKERISKEAYTLSTSTFLGDKMIRIEEDLKYNTSARRLVRIMPWKAFAYDMLKYISCLEEKIKGIDCELALMYDANDTLKCKLQVEEADNDLFNNEIARLRNELMAYKAKKEEQENRFKWLKWFKK